MCDSIGMYTLTKSLSRSNLLPPWIHRSCTWSSSFPSSRAFLRPNSWPEYRTSVSRNDPSAMFQARALTAALTDDSSSSSSSPVSVDLLHICSEDQFDLVVSDEENQPVVILWMATWCRKCIYLKPKLEKLAAEYYPRLRFYCIDVNKVSHKLVASAGVTKMPSIQLWRDGRKQADIIGGQKAHFVMNEVRQMIESGNMNETWNYPTE